MILKNSMRSIRRTPGKTVLFMLLITAVTLFLVLSSSMLFASGDMLDSADENFSTIVTFTAADGATPEDFDAAALSDFDNVISFDTPHYYSGLAPGCELYRADNGYKYASVLSISRVHPSKSSFYNATASKNPYSYIGDNDRFISVFEEVVEFSPITGHRYIVCGKFIPEKRANGFMLIDVADLVPVDTVCGVDVNSIETILDVTDTIDEFRKNTDGIYYKLGELFNRCGNSLPVTATSDIENLEDFHQQEAVLLSGRYFTDEEYATDANVCVVTEIIADVMDLELGDSFSMSLSEAFNGFASDSFWAGESQPSKDYTVVGIIKTSNDKRDSVYIPKSAEFDTYISGETLGIAHIENGTATEYLHSVEGLTGAGVDVFVYDQGYSAVTHSIISMRDNAVVMMGVCLPAAAAVLLLFAFIFVGRQRENVEIMLSLGTGKRRASRYLLYGCGFISVFSVVLGSVLAALSSSALIRFVYMLQFNSTVKGLRFSNGRFGIIKDYAFDISVKPVQLILSAFIILLVAAVLCLIFALFIFKKRAVTRKPKKERKLKPPAEPASMLKSSAVKYSLISIKRGGSRSLVVTAATLVLTIFLSFLATTYQGYKEQIHELDLTSTISGSFIDYAGKTTQNLLIPLASAYSLYESGFADSFSMARVDSYKFHGISKLSTGKRFELEEFYIPRTEFAYESLVATTQFDPRLIYTNDIFSLAQFSGKEFDISYIDGYDSSFFSGKKCEACVVSTGFLKDRNVSLGDTVCLVVGTDFTTRNILIAGSFEGETDSVFLPLATYLNLPWPVSPEQLLQNAKDALYEYITNTENPDIISTDDIVMNTSFTSCSFVLKDASRLADFKDFLEDNGYSQVRSVNVERTWLIFNDSEYNEARGNLLRSVNYFNLLYVLLFILVGAFGYIISFLLITRRKPEYAVMRGLGAKKGYSLRCFFNEQLLLSLAGVALGLLIWLPIGGISLLQLGLVGVFILFYLFGCNRSVATLAKVSVISILTSKD